MNDFLIFHNFLNSQKTMTNSLTKSLLLLVIFMAYTVESRVIESTTKFTIPSNSSEPSMPKESVNATDHSAVPTMEDPIVDSFANFTLPSNSSESSMPEEVMNTTDNSAASNG